MSLAERTQATFKRRFCERCMTKALDSSGRMQNLEVHVANGRTARDLTGGIRLVGGIQHAASSRCVQPSIL